MCCVELGRRVEPDERLDVADSVGPVDVVETMENAVDEISAVTGIQCGQGIVQIEAGLDAIVREIA